MQMKRWIIFVLALGMLFSLTACGSSNAKDDAAAATESAEPAEQDVLAELEARDYTSVSADGALTWTATELTEKYNATLEQIDSGLTVQLKDVPGTSMLGGGLYAGDDVVGVFTFSLAASVDPTGNTPNVVDYFDIAVLDGDADQMQNAMAAMMMTLDDSLSYDDALALLELLVENEKVDLHGVTYDASLCLDPNTIDTIRFHF